MMVTIPVTIGFEYDRVIGELRIDRNALPPKPDYHFALGYRKNSADGYDLVCLGLVPDSHAAA